MGKDLEKRVQQFRCLELPGQPHGMHMGTSYLVGDLWGEVQRQREIAEADYRKWEEFAHALQARADNAYCDFIGLCRRDECLGWEAKVEKGLFGEAELKAHKDAAEKLGRHRALQEAANLLHELLTPNDAGKRHP